MRMFMRMTSGGQARARSTASAPVVASPTTVMSSSRSSRTLKPDRTRPSPADPRRPAHHRLLGADIPIIEHLTNLQAIPDDGAHLIAFPAPVSGMASFPVRAVAVLPG
jgi:kynurenine formamidase